MPKNDGGRTGDIAQTLIAFARREMGENDRENKMLRSAAKRLVTLEKRVEDLMAENAELREENAVLRERVAIMEENREAPADEIRAETAQPVYDWDDMWPIQEG